MKDLFSLLEAEAYEFKEPWRVTDKSLAIVVPIISKRPRTRNYVVLEEVKDKVEIEDTGGIHKVRIRGNVDKPTFIRGGTMLKGATQERATQYSIVVMPQKSEEIPVHCIHASKGIRPGVSFFAAGHVPRTIHANMLAARSQSYTWSAVSNYRASLHAPEASMGLADVGADDLVGTVETIQRFREDLKEILKAIPDYVNQVGTVIIDPDGVVGLEMYDHPDSWKAFSESVMRSFSEALTKEDKTGIFKPDMNVIIPIIQAFLEEIKKAEEEEVFNKNNAKTVILKAEGYVGEYTDLNAKTIHLLITRCEKQPPRKPEPLIRRRLWAWPERRATERRHVPAESYAVTYLHTPAEAVVDWSKRYQRKWKRSLGILSVLDKPKTWTSLKEELPVSKATLSSRLKDLQQLGAVDKFRSENGVTRYCLTGFGHELLKSKKTKQLQHPHGIT